MQLTKTTVQSGNVNVDGFLLENKFIAAEPFCNYISWDFNGHEEFSLSNATLNRLDFDIEPVCIIAGTYVGDPNALSINRIRVRITPPVSSIYPDNLVFSDDLSHSLPYFFPKNLFFPKASLIYFGFSGTASYMKFLAKPIYVQSVGTLYALP